MNAKLRRHVLQKYLDLNKEKKKWCWTRSLFVKFVKQKIGAPDSSLLFPTFQPGWKIMFQMCYQRQKPHKRPEAEVSEVWSGDGDGHVICSSWADATAFTRGQLRFCETMIFRKGPHKKHADKTVLCLKSPVCFQVPQALVWIRTRHPLSTCSPWAFKANSLGLNSRQNIAIWNIAWLLSSTKKRKERQNDVKASAVVASLKTSSFWHSTTHPPVPNPVKSSFSTLPGKNIACSNDFCQSTSPTAVVASLKIKWVKKNTISSPVRLGVSAALLRFQTESQHHLQLCDAEFGQVPAGEHCPYGPRFHRIDQIW